MGLNIQQTPQTETCLNMECPKVAQCRVQWQLVLYAAPVCKFVFYKSGEFLVYVSSISCWRSILWSGV